jgi:hypothetical protein
MKKQRDKNVDEVPSDWEPPWMNPENDRKTPYTEEELEEFAEGFISNMSDIAEVRDMIKQKGIDDVKEIAKEGFRKQAERILVNTTVKGFVH